MSASGSSKKFANRLVALSSAAVFAVYSAGYMRTQTAADRLDAETREAVVPAASSAPRTEEAKPAPGPVTTTAASTTAVAASPVVPAAASTPEAAPVAAPVVAKVEPAPVAAPVAPTPAPVAPAPAPEPPPPPAKTVWKDGTYTGWGYSRHGDIQAQVVIEGGRIKAATIAQCLTRYSCSVIDKLPPQVAERQSPETDYVSGATQSTNAFYYGVVEALNKAK
jgi:uncharacterized protein with FMN-binding domain